MAKIHRKIGLVLFLLMLLSISLTAKLQQNIERPDTLWLGSNIYLKLSAEVDLEAIVPPDTMSNFAIIKVEKLADTGKPTALKLTIVSLDTGAQTFPSLVVKAAKRTIDSLRTDAFGLTIRESRPTQDSTLKDIADNQKLPGEMPWWAYYLIGSVLICSILAMIIYLLLKLRKSKQVFPAEQSEPQDQRKAWEKALDALLELQAKNLPEQQSYILYHFNLSEIIKLFLEAELGFKANEMTTREIKHHFRKSYNSGLSETESQNLHNTLANTPLRLSYTDENIIISWLESCDRIKFARQVPSLPECQNRMTDIQNWLMNYGKRDLAHSVAPEQPHA